MARSTKQRGPGGRARKTVGLGLLEGESRHGFLIEIPKGTSKTDCIRITEHRNVDLSIIDSEEMLEKLLETQDSPVSSPVSHVVAMRKLDSAPSTRVVIDRERWLALAPAFWDEANRRLRANGLTTCKFQKNVSKPVPVHPSLGKELCVLCWAVEDTHPDLIPNALLNWEVLAPEERWWLYTMTVATTGQALQHRGLGWRKALRAALAENPFIKGDGAPARSRRDLLSHSQLTLDLDL